MMKSKQHRDDAIAILVVGIIIALAFAGSRYSWFRLFFAWPGGGTWSNTIAWLEDDAIALFAVWYFRQHLIPRASSLWRTLNKHHTETIHNHVTSEINALATRWRRELSAHHDKIVEVVRNNASADGSACD